MSAQQDPGIELHFCRDCGISIPIADIESGRANPALPGCSYGRDVCSNRADDPVAAPAPAGAAAAANDGALKLVAALALLYVVGATTFLLIRELRREPPEVQLPTDVAMVRDIHDLERALESVREQTGVALEQLKQNDALTSSTLSSLRKRTQELSEVVAKESSASQQRDRELSRGLLILTDETKGLKTPIGDILKRRDRMKAGGGAPAKAGPAKSDDDTPEPKDGGSQPTEDPLARQQAAEFIAQLSDRDATDQTRYNAAVQLGDLGHPSAVPPLLAALEKDPYDLVRRAAAFSLGLLGKHSVPAVPALIEGVSKQEEYVGYMCARALTDIAKAALNQNVEFDYDPNMSAKERRGVMKKWQGWWDKNKALIKQSSSG